MRYSIFTDTMAAEHSGRAAACHRREVITGPTGIESVVVA